MNNKNRYINCFFYLLRELETSEGMVLMVASEGTVELVFELDKSCILFRMHDGCRATA